MIRGPLEIPVRVQRDVRVRITKPELYPLGVDAANGKIGRVVRFNPRSFHGYEQNKLGPCYLVRFPEPIKVDDAFSIPEIWVAKRDLRKRKP